MKNGNLVSRFSRLALGIRRAPRHAALCISALALATTAEAANLVQNGGFEETTLNISSILGPVHADQSVIGWTHEAVAGTPIGQADSVVLPGTADTTGILNPQGGNQVFLYGPGNGVNNGLTPTSPAGGNFVVLDGDDVVRAPFNQTINGLTPGLAHIFTFYWAGAQQFSANVPTTGATTDSFQVSLGSQTLTTEILQNESKGFTGWRQATMTFTPTSTSEVLSFLSVGTPIGLPPMALLDGVSLNAVPEPSTWALMVGSLAGFAGFARLRRKTAKN